MLEVLAPELVVPTWYPLAIPLLEGQSFQRIFFTGDSPLENLCTEPAIGSHYELHCRLGCLMLIPGHVVAAIEVSWWVLPSSLAPLPAFDVLPCSEVCTLFVDDCSKFWSYAFASADSNSCSINRSCRLSGRLRADWCVKQTRRLNWQTGIRRPTPCGSAESHTQPESARKNLKESQWFFTVPVLFMIIHWHVTRALSAQHHRQRVCIPGVDVFDDLVRL